ncbi:Casparian strip membrane protein domain [Dillenia turbinata]|uniref:CASP-like protein n=1 Tax=Dillenia turbinata TaxID=194707 RepID=A0AAN8UL14_9MAGN
MHEEDENRVSDSQQSTTNSTPYLSPDSHHRPSRSISPPSDNMSPELTASPERTSASKSNDLSPKQNENQISDAQQSTTNSPPYLSPDSHRPRRSFSPPSENKPPERTAVSKSNDLPTKQDENRVSDAQQSTTNSPRYLSPDSHHPRRSFLPPSENKQKERTSVSNSNDLSTKQEGQDEDEDEELHSPSPSWSPPPGTVPGWTQSPVVVMSRSVRDEPKVVTKSDQKAEDGYVIGGMDAGGGSGRRTTRPPLSILKRGKRESKLKKAKLGFRICGFLFCLVSFSVMAADRNQGWAMDSFSRYKEFRYLLGVNVIGFVYSGIQAYDVSHNLVTAKYAINQNQLRYSFDLLILAYLLISASSSAATRVEDWESNWGKDKFPDMAKVSVAISFLAFVAFATNSLLSGYSLASLKSTLSAINSGDKLQPPTVTFKNPDKGSGFSIGGDVIGGVDDSKDVGSGSGTSKGIGVIKGASYLGEGERDW